MLSLKQVSTLLLIGSLTGCSTNGDFFEIFTKDGELNKSTNRLATNSLSKYYLWIKSLDKQALNEEIKYQQSLEAKTDLESSNQAKQQAKLYMILLHSLPAATVHNPYTAKAILNDKTFSRYIQQHLSLHDLALLTLLKDQLNQQLLHLRASDLQKKSYQTKNAQLQLKLTMQQQAITSLNAKLEQLKTIEAAISKREQNQ